MNSKSIIVLVSIFVLQSITSCIPCKCDPPATYEVTYDSITIIPWNTSGFNATEVADVAYRNAFGLSLTANFEPQKIACHSLGLGFSAAMACSCADDKYLFNNPVAYADIFMTDLANGEQTEVSALFGAYGYGDELITLEELFEIRQEWHDGFQFELTTFEDVPDAVTFTVDLYLESGIKFTEQTKEINFID